MLQGHKDLIGRFKPANAIKWVVVGVDEFYCPGMAELELLKAFARSLWMRLEVKQKDVRYVKNHVMCYFFSNQDNPIPCMGTNERTAEMHYVLADPLIDNPCVFGEEKPDGTFIYGPLGMFMVGRAMEKFKTNNVNDDRIRDYMMDMENRKSDYWTYLNCSLIRPKEGIDNYGRNMTPSRALLPLRTFINFLYKIQIPEGEQLSDQLKTPLFYLCVKAVNIIKITRNNIYRTFLL